MSPEKRDGAPTYNAPLPNLNLPRTSSAFHASPQAACKHQATVTQQEPPGTPHYSREVCLQCGAFLRWLPSPKTIERQKLNAFKLTKLSMHPDLNDWERDFLKSISAQKHLSPKQQAVLDKLVAKYLERKTP